VVERPDSGGTVLTGRLSLRLNRGWPITWWAGWCCFPGPAFVELVIRAGDEVACEVIKELVLAAPLVLDEDAGAQVQVVVGAAAESGSRAVSVYSRRDESEAEWLLHAEGTLASPPRRPRRSVGVGHPGAVSVDMSDGYGRLAARGYEYGPAFQGLVAIWRRGPELFAEVARPARPVCRSTRWGSIQPSWMRYCTP